jgi:hypothetical protein
VQIIRNCQTSIKVLDSGKGASWSLEPSACNAQILNRDGFDLPISSNDRFARAFARETIVVISHPSPGHAARVDVPAGDAGTFFKSQFVRVYLFEPEPRIPICELSLVMTHTTPISLLIEIMNGYPGVENKGKQRNLNPICKDYKFLVNRLVTRYLQYLDFVINSRKKYS